MQGFGGCFVYEAAFSIQIHPCIHACMPCTAAAPAAAGGQAACVLTPCLATIYCKAIACVPRLFIMPGVLHDFSAVGWPCLVGFVVLPDAASCDAELS
jgi:hypothetical protein